MKAPVDLINAICDHGDPSLSYGNTPRVAPPELDRRDFLRVGALAGGGFLLVFKMPGEAWAQAAGALDDTAKQFTPNPFIKITPENIITILAKNPETGQGVKTSLPMIVAEELDADFSTIVIEQAALRPDVGAQFAGGSRSTPDNYMRLRQAGATARTMLVEAAAQTWGVPASELTTEKGKVIHTASGKSLTYGQLATKAATLPIPDEKTVRLKKEGEFRVMGSRVGGVDNPAIVTGKPLFGIDQKFPGLVYAAIEKCPVYGGKLVKANVDRIKKLPGITDCFTIEGTDNIVGLRPAVVIVGNSTWATFSAKRQLQVEWDESAGDGHSTETYAAKAAELAKAGGTNARTDGDVNAAFSSATKVVEAAYSYPFLNHATLEPQGCTAWARDGGIEFWSTTQTPGSGQDLVAKTLNIPKEKIKINFVRGGGGFGRRLANDYMVESAAIALKLNVPVKLTWTREDDMRQDCYARPGGFHFLKGSVDAQGKISAWQNHFVTFGYLSTEKVASSADLSPDELPARFLANFRLDQSILSTNIPTGPMRAPRSNALAFVMQSFIDELAHAGGRDPVDVRLDLLGEDRLVQPANNRGVPYDTARMKGVVKLAAEKSNWKSPLPKGEGRGVAFHFSHSGYVAMVAHVAVTKDGTLQVKEVTAACDVGPIINLSGAENQVEGSVVDGLGAAWLQELTHEGGKALQSNFHDFPLLRINAAPTKIATHFIQSNNPPTGLGEPPYPVVPPAICNAIFAATGKRVRQLPITKADLSWS